MRIVGVIPARYASSRFPGKPLADICGKPMIWWVFQQANKVKELAEVYVATDDKRIEDICNNYNIPVIMTSQSCKNGTERVAEVALKLPADIYINIQGDEPILEPSVIQTAVNIMLDDNSVKCATLKMKLEHPVDVVNGTITKVVNDRNGNIMFLSRSPIPYPKASVDYNYYKHIGLYAYRFDILKAYNEMPIGELEKAEDIEILRLLENGIKIQVREVVSNSIAVDTEKDLERVCEYIKYIIPHHPPPLTR
jgi:3-deoxy-manno-octulosonate cytidylyltransferase (CMP-KDO synthetase)